MNSGKLLLGVLAGTAVGAALGLLFAPKKGSESREDLTRKGEDIWGNVKTKFDDLIASASEEIKDAKKEAHNLYSKAKDKGKEAKSELENSANAQ